MDQKIGQKLIDSHLVEGGMNPGAPIALRIDQTLLQDATGTLAMLSLEAMALDRVKTEVSVQYVDHNLLQIDNLNADDHLFLESACRRLGLVLAAGQWHQPRCPYGALRSARQIDARLR
jgi:aconitate hydratase